MTPTQQRAALERAAAELVIYRMVLPAPVARALNDVVSVVRELVDATVLHDSRLEYLEHAERATSAHIRDERDERVMPRESFGSGD